MKQEFLTKQNDRSLPDLFNTIQRCAYQLSTVSSIYKSRVASYDWKLMTETQSLKDELEQEKGQSSKLSAAIEKLEEKVALFESKTTVDAAPLQTTADAAPSGVEKSHGEEADPPAKAP
ncbi:hypothetical protein CISIN_1g044028mg [Citrus sinensis]|uniref:Uncharacterized protein n=1 Tax=Citrus sinensis TaxID=2711 RepID=A0A067F5L1_CITSI|nr:hypothetical protein CISIN_1g044028mg [Citrus sinensis]